MIREPRYGFLLRDCRICEKEKQEKKEKVKSFKEMKEDEKLENVLIDDSGSTKSKGKTTQ